MNEFLDQVYFDNTVRSYLIVAFIILFVVIVKRYLARSICRIYFSFCKSGMEGCR